jgi:hypothetical protein
VSFLPCAFDFENVIDEVDLVVRAFKHQVRTSAQLVFVVPHRAAGQIVDAGP